MLLNIFQFAHRNFIGYPFFCLIFTDSFHIFPALNSAPDQHMSAYFKSRSISGISSPAYTWYVIGFSVRTVDCHQKIRNLSSKRSFSVYRRFADIPVQKNLIDRYGFLSLFHKFHFPGKYRKHKSISLFLMTVIGPELSMDLDILSHIVLRDIDQPLGHHHRNPVLRIAETFYQNIHHIKTFSKNLMAEGKSGGNAPHNRYLIVFNNFICHNK